MRHEIVMYRARTHLRALQSLVDQCHPTRAARPTAYWFAHPTLVVEHPTHPDDALIGYASFSVVAGVMYGVDLGVHPDWRHQGIGTALFRERLNIGTLLGEIEQFIGVTQVENAHMKKIFEAGGMEFQGIVEKHYIDVPEPVDGAVYVGRRGDWKL